LICDEPTVGVDPQLRNHVFESIEALSKQGITLLYTTNYMEEAQRLCDRVAIMVHGRIMAVDTVESLIDPHGGT
jgi:ABC-2 type transport system ATP-binding protein